MSVGIVDKQTGERIPTAGMPAIDDALDLTSVNPVQNAVITAALANKQNKTDNSLQTTDKTVVGAVNELKSGLTNVGTYSTTPVKIGNWLGHDIYRKVVSLGALPNSTLLDVASGLTNEVIVNIYGIALETNSTYTLPLPFISATQGNLIEIGYNNTFHAIRVISTMDVSSFEGYVVLDYYTAS